MLAVFRHGALVCGDPVKVLEGLTGVFTVIYTDPPYGVSREEWDDPELFFSMEELLYNTASRDAWLVFWWPTKRLPDAFRLRRFTYWWQIVVVHKGFRSRWGRLGRSMYSSLLVFAKGSPKLARSEDDLVFAGEIPVVERLPSKLSKPSQAHIHVVGMFAGRDGLLLDPFAGTGTIPMVCELVGTRWFAVEKDSELCKTATRIVAGGSGYDPVILDYSRDLLLQVFRRLYGVDVVS